MDNKDLESILRSKSYVGPIYTSGRIIEYDIAKCNISMLKKYGAIDDGTFTFLLNLPKFEREKEIGLMILNNNSLYDIISNGTEYAKIRLAELNNINANEIVRVANDALYINRFTDLLYTKIDEYIEFKPKSISSVVLFVSNSVSVYYNRNNITGEINIDIKGLGDKAELHSNYFSSFIATVITLLEYSSLNDTIEFIKNFYNDYINKKLDIGFYREFNSNSMYSIAHSGYYISHVDSLDIVDIKYNMNIIRNIWSIVLQRIK